MASQASTPHGVAYLFQLGRKGEVSLSQLDQPDHSFLPLIGIQCDPN
jgi:hypothetical protein